MIAGVDPAEWRKLLSQANSGQLALDPEVAKGLDRVCDDYLHQLDTIMKGADRLRFVGGFGPFQSGKDLQDKFRSKAVGTDQSLEAVLKQHIDVVKTAKEVVAKAISNFGATDQNYADGISGTEGQR